MNEQCDCSCADKCPLDRIGSRTRCTAGELRAALLERMKPGPIYMQSGTYEDGYVDGVKASVILAGGKP